MHRHLQANITREEVAEPSGGHLISGPALGSAPLSLKSSRRARTSIRPRFQTRAQSRRRSLLSNMFSARASQGAFAWHSGIMEQVHTPAAAVSSSNYDDEFDDMDFSDAVFDQIDRVVHAHLSGSQPTNDQTGFAKQPRRPLYSNPAQQLQTATSKQSIDTRTANANFRTLYLPQSSAHAHAQDQDQTQSQPQNKEDHQAQANSQVQAQAQAQEQAQAQIQVHAQAQAHQHAHASFFSSPQTQSGTLQHTVRNAWPQQSHQPNSQPEPSQAAFSLEPWLQSCLRDHQREGVEFLHRAVVIGTQTPSGTCFGECLQHTHTGYIYTL